MNKMIASDGASLSFFPGVIVFTSGFHISVISGFIAMGEVAGTGLTYGFCWAIVMIEDERNILVMASLAVTDLIVNIEV